VDGAKITKISVIIPTRNRRDSLGRLIDSLRLTRGLDQFCQEVIVVNNASADSSASFLQTTERDWQLLRVLEEPRPGKNYALNRGLKLASGGILCLMDDDILLDPGWLLALASDFEKTQYDALQPRVLPGVDPDGQQADRGMLYYYNIPVIDYGNSMRALRGLTGVIMAFRKTVYENIGGFDERLPASGYHGDTEFSKRIRNAGFRIGYAPEVVVYHELNPERYGSAYARISQYRKGLSRSVYGDDSMFGNVLPNLAANCFRYGIYLVGRKTDKVYKTEKRIMKYWGYLVGRMNRRLGKDPWK
jgi:GT2 family glycosyltransferase